MKKRLEIIQQAILSNPYLFAALAILLIIFNYISWDHLIFQNLTDSSHAFVFFFATLLVLKNVKRQANHSQFRHLIWWGGICFCVGLVIEIIQPYLGRERSALDLAYNMIGIIAAAGIHLRYKPAGLLLLISLIIPINSAVLMIAKQEQFPMLYNFELSRGDLFWSLNEKSTLELGKPPATWKNPTQVAKVSLINGRYPGISFHYFPSDWREFRHLTMEVYSDQAIQLKFRVADETHDQTYSDRYNTLIPIKPGLNFIKIGMSDLKNAPKNREMNLSKIKGMTLFTSSPKHPIQFYLDNLQLK